LFVCVWSAWQAAINHTAVDLDMDMDDDDDDDNDDNAAPARPVAANANTTNTAIAPFKTPVPSRLAGHGMAPTSAAAADASLRQAQTSSSGRSGFYIFILIHFFLVLTGLSSLSLS
jgi:hypothetical protein